MRNRDKTRQDAFLWRDWWLGVYRRGFGLYLEADLRERRRARRRGLAVALAAVPLFALLFELAASGIDVGSFHYQLAIERLAAGDRETGIAELRKAVEKSPGAVRYRVRLGWELLKARLLRQAVDQLARIIPARPGFVASLLVLAFASYYGSVVLGLYWQTRARNRMRALHRM